MTSNHFVLGHPAKELIFQPSPGNFRGEFQRPSEQPQPPQGSVRRWNILCLGLAVIQSLLFHGAECRGKK